MKDKSIIIIIIIIILFYFIFLLERLNMDGLIYYLSVSLLCI